MFVHTSRSSTRLTRLATPQAERITGRITYLAPTTDDWQTLDRILVIADEAFDARAVRACIALDGPRTVRRIVEVSSMGSAASNGPALRALALAAAVGNAATREMAIEAVPEVARSVAEYFVFVEEEKLGTE